MQRFTLLMSSAAMFALPFLVSAQAANPNPQFNATGGAFGTLLRNILTFTQNYLIPFILGIGFLVFAWGMFQYFIAGGANDESKEKGKSLMVYATLGFVLILVFWGVINLLASSTGFTNSNINNLTPAVPTIP